MVIDISIGLIAIAFVVLVIYLIVFINSLKITLNEVDKTVASVRIHLDEMSNQAKKTVEHTNQISFDLKRKMESLNPLFNTFSNVGEVLESKTTYLKKEALASQKERLSELENHEAEKEVRSHDEIKVADILELAGIGIRLWNKIRHRHSPGA